MKIKNFTRDNRLPKEDDKIVYIAGDWDILRNSLKDNIKF